MNLKAHTSIANVLLQLLDEGHLTDGRGKKVDFKNTIIIMTSNFGSQFIIEQQLGRGLPQFDENDELVTTNGPLDDMDGFDEVHGSHDDHGSEKVKEEILTLMKEYFSPEFLNRIDDIVLFKPLQIAQMKSIVEIQLKGLRKRLAEKKIELDLTEYALEQLGMIGYDPSFGARPVKRVIQQKIEMNLLI